VYGKVTDPPAEYYIVEDWFGNQWEADTDAVTNRTFCYGNGEYCEDKGEVTVDGFFCSFAG
jgi:hypothetical protein